MSIDGGPRSAANRPVRWLRGLDAGQSVLYLVLLFLLTTFILVPIAQVLYVAFTCVHQTNRLPGLHHLSRNRMAELGELDDGLLIAKDDKAGI